MARNGELGVATTPARTAAEDGIVPVLERLRPRLVAALSLQCGSLVVAEEIAQEACVRLWLRWADVGTKRSPEAWAFRVAFNLANSWWRRRVVELRTLHRQDRMPLGEPSDDLGEALDVRNALQRISKRRRTALILRYYLDLSLRETAQVMECAPGTVKALCSQGRADLRRFLGAEEDGVR